MNLSNYSIGEIIEKDGSFWKVEKCARKCPKKECGPQAKKDSPKLSPRKLEYALQKKKAQNEGRIFTGLNMLKSKKPSPKNTKAAKEAEKAKAKAAKEAEKAAAKAAKEAEKAAENDKGKKKGVQKKSKGS